MNSSDEDRFGRLGEFLTESMARNHVPGASVGIVFGDREMSAGYGVTNVDHPLKVTDETFFQIGSITKTFTGLLIQRLAEMGKLSLDDSVQSFLPNFQVADKDASDQATIRHLLTHTGGWAGDFFHDTGSGDDALTRYVEDMSKLEQLAPIGQIWSYNNAGFTVAGAIIEKITGQPYEKALKEIVLDPLGLDNFYLDAADVMTYRFATGHGQEDGQAIVVRPWDLPRSINPIGGLICHVKALMRYARYQLGHELKSNGDSGKVGELLRPESLAEMHTQQVKIGQVHDGMGLTWFNNSVDGALTLSHGGGTKGQISVLLMVPERDFALVILTNGAYGGHVIDEVKAWALEQYLDIKTFKPAPTEFTEENLSSFNGRYERPYMNIELKVGEGKLRAHLTPKGSFPSEDIPVSPPPPPMTCAFYGPDYFIVQDGEYQNSIGEFIRNEDRTIGWLRFGSRIHKRID